MECPGGWRCGVERSDESEDDEGEEPESSNGGYETRRTADTKTAGALSRPAGSLVFRALVRGLVSRARRGHRRVGVTVVVVVRAKDIECCFVVPRVFR
jgi:hypothetical protein